MIFYRLKDQALALQWVYSNIEQFGGNKDQISLFGQSAGGVSAHIHLLANKTTNLFQSGISLSGSAFGFWPIVQKQRALNFTKRLAKSLHCPEGGSATLMKCLRSTRANFIIAAQLHFFVSNVQWMGYYNIVTVSNCH